MEHVIFILEILGTIAFSLSGVLVAKEKDMDVFGVIMLGITTGCGGGIIRDIITGATPPAVFTQPVYCLVAALTAALACIPALTKFVCRDTPIADRVMNIIDAVGLGCFTSVAVANCYGQFPENLFLITFVGCVSGVGGGVLRDIFAGEVPYIFKKHIYASASIAGALLCGILLRYINSAVAILSGIALVVFIRALAARYRLSLPHIKSGAGDK